MTDPSLSEFRNTNVCIYCDGRRLDETFSDEHIWPQALGGDSCPEIFRSHQVCGKCNNIAGQWVDRAFMRNFFTSNERRNTATEFLSPDEPSAVPLVFFGLDTEIPLSEHEICERWLGPSGESIYHIHKKDDSRWATLAGGDFYKRKSDRGRIYFTLTDESSYWFSVVVISILKFFPGIRPRCLATIQDLPSTWPLSDVNQEPFAEGEVGEINWILNRPKGMQRNQLVVDLGYADRFLAKLAIGLTHTVLGPKATFSRYGDELRNLLWCSDFSKRDELSVRGIGPWDIDAFSEIKKYIGYPGVWSIFLTSAEGSFCFVLGTPSGRFMSMVMSDEPALWNLDPLDIHWRGAVYLIVPQRNKTFGPIPLISLIAHHQEHCELPELRELEALRTGVKGLPPHERPADDHGDTDGDTDQLPERN